MTLRTKVHLKQLHCDKKENSDIFIYMSLDIVIVAECRKISTFRQFIDGMSLTFEISNDDCASFNYLLDTRNLIRHKINYCIFSFICVIKEQQNHVAYEQ